MSPSHPFRLLSALGLAAACNNQSLKVVRDPPAVVITEPSTGTTFYEGQSVNFVAQVEVRNPADTEDITAFTHTWVSGNETLCEDEPVAADGSAECSWIFDSVGEKTVEVTVTDIRLDRAQASTTVVVIDNTAPTIEVLSPADGEAFAVDELVRIDAFVTDLEEDPSNLIVSLSSSLQGDLPVSASPSSTGDFTAGIYLDPGTHLVTVRVEDSYGQTDQDTVQVEVYEHGPPRAEGVVISPEPAYTDDQLQAVVNGWFDMDGAPERYRYQWFKDDGAGAMLEVAGEVSATFPPGKTTRGDLLQVVATPYNEYGDGDVLVSSTIEILNTAPTAPSIAISPASPEPTTPLLCSITVPGWDADADLVSYEYTWNRNGAPAGITTNAVPTTELVHGDLWECVVVATDGLDDSLAVSASVIINDATAPGAPTIDTPVRYRNEADWTLTGACEPGCTLDFTCSDGWTSWSSSQVCDSAGRFSTSQSLTRGNTSECSATCTDGAGNTSPNSNTVTTEVCDPFDAWEDSTGYGDAGTDPIDAWGVLNDFGTTTISIEGNVLGGDSSDWYVISTTDDRSSDLSAGINYYNFAVSMTDGLSDYGFRVYKETPDATDLECSAAYSATGYDQYNDYQADRGDGVHAVPSDVRLCGSGSSTRNDCTDMSNDYYIEVFRTRSTISSCQGYSLTITNGVW